MSDGLDLGPDFVWGAATSAYQIEGAAGEDGRAPSIWDTFCQVPGAIDNGDSGAEACDHYHRWPRDIALMGELGLDAYRFSVAWPRVLPEGTGAVNQAGLDFYDRLVDGLLAAGIRPFTTLYHWDLPQALQDRGGWPSRDTAAAWRADGHTNRWWLDPLHGRGYPADMLDVYQVEPPVRAGDLELIATPMEHLGLNYYFRQVVADDPAGPIPYARRVHVPGSQLTEMGWELYPDGLEELLLRLTGEYQVPRLYVTESGSAWADDVHQDGNIADAERTRYLEAHLAASGRAVRRGVPLAGYFVWSLLDNFEWAYGYAKRFGLVHVDYPTQRRTIKASGRRYAEIIRAYKRGEPVFQTMTSRSSR